jgi:hypothetical protein
MGKHTKRHVSLESGLSFVEGALHSKAMFERGDPRLNPRPPWIRSTPISEARRSLWLRMPDNNRKEGEALPEPPHALVVWHEYFNSCIVLPPWRANIVSFYGRRIDKGSIKQALSE